MSDTKNSFVVLSSSLAKITDVVNLAPVPSVANPVEATFRTSNA